MFLPSAALGADNCHCFSSVPAAAGLFSMSFSFSVQLMAQKVPDLSLAPAVFDCLLLSTLISAR